MATAQRSQRLVQLSEATQAAKGAPTEGAEGVEGRVSPNRWHKMRGLVSFSTPHSFSELPSAGSEEAEVLLASPSRSKRRMRGLLRAISAAVTPASLAATAGAAARRRRLQPTSGPRAVGCGGGRGIRGGGGAGGGGGGGRAARTGSDAALLCAFPSRAALVAPRAAPPRATQTPRGPLPRARPASSAVGPRLFRRGGAGGAPRSITQLQ